MAKSNCTRDSRFLKGLMIGGLMFSFMAGQRLEDSRQTGFMYKSHDVK